ncbi:hypothetical protein E2K80_04300 [Rhodophyticola sp. CCM32]|uniref:hypothetical protein n=1 Tax=Rhodophyticola sp. CCM32 TaxID=2916397 RepID=UPI00107FA7E6|nr:hypothetical protein [Rhodophyticola sp. CCM32]QBY00056.1 hypothetical protein E2K80_04300 [Rhodophyticola sp. CCM32]
MTNISKDLQPNEVHTGLRRHEKPIGKKAMTGVLAKRSRLADTLAQQSEEDDLLEDLFNDMPV